jgi:hypothetical protein
VKIPPTKCGQDKLHIFSTTFSWQLFLLSAKDNNEQQWWPPSSAKE